MTLAPAGVDLRFTFVQNDIYIYTIILVFPICVDKFLTDVNLLGLEVT